jgi:L-lysine 6-transaminase
VKTSYFTQFDWPRITNPKLSFPATPQVLERVEAEERRAVAEIERAFSLHGDDICAILIETIQGEGGDNHFRGEFLRQLRVLADENDAFLIFDEVQAGLGMTGRMWAYEHFGVVPDAISFGKKVQLGGTCVGRRVDEVAENVFRVKSRINSTWGGNLVDMLRAARILEVIHEEDLVQNAATVGAHLVAGLRGLEARHPQRVSNARGLGLMCAFDLPDKETRTRVLGMALERGLMIVGCGERSIRFRPALNIATQDVDEALGVLDDVIGTL